MSRPLRRPYAYQIPAHRATLRMHWLILSGLSLWRPRAPGTVMLLGYMSSTSCAARHREALRTLVMFRYAEQDGPNYRLTPAGGRLRDELASMLNS